MASASNYVIGSGWWCANAKDQDGRDKFLGSDQIRGKGFHQLWYRSIDANTNPQKIIIVDSASPITPELNQADTRIEWVSLPFNAGHSSNHLGKYCGWTRGMMVGLEYAVLSDADYFVYVEQDVLLVGQGIVEACIDAMHAPYMFGSGEGTPQLLQQSFFIIRKDGMRRFIERIHSIPERDCELFPEDKFFIAASSMGSFARFLFRSLRRNRKGWFRKKLTKTMVKLYQGHDCLPFGYGRDRPIAFHDQFYYFQHGSESELKQYLERVAGGAKDGRNQDC